jgi:hypothetical protein
MAKRTIKVALATYKSAKGQGGEFGFRGQEVDVADDDLERFDELNENPGGDEPWEQERVAVEMVSPAAGERTSGADSGLNTTVDVDDEGNPEDDSTAEDDAKDEDSPKGVARRGRPPGKRTGSRATRK